MLPGCRSRTPISGLCSRLRILYLWDSSLTYTSCDCFANSQFHGDCLSAYQILWLFWFCDYFPLFPNTEANNAFLFSKFPMKYLAYCGGINEWRPFSKQSEDSSDASSDLKRSSHYNGNGIYRASSIRKAAADVERNGSFRGSFRDFIQKKKFFILTSDSDNGVFCFIEFICRLKVCF